jgi:hypothetical protein
MKFLEVNVDEINDICSKSIAVLSKSEIEEVRALCNRCIDEVSGKMIGLTEGWQRISEIRDALLKKIMERTGIDLKQGK